MNSTTQSINGKSINLSIINIIIFKNGTLIDVIGTEDGPSSNAWSVAGISNATEKHTLVRKQTDGNNEGNNGDWSSSAGTNSENSEWIVYGEDTFNYFGFHGDEDIVITACMNQTAVNFNSNATEESIYSKVFKNCF